MILQEDRTHRPPIDDMANRQKLSGGGSDRTARSLDRTSLPSGSMRLYVNTSPTSAFTSSTQPRITSVEKVTSGGGGSKTGQVSAVWHKVLAMPIALTKNVSAITKAMWAGKLWSAESNTTNWNETRSIPAPSSNVNSVSAALGSVIVVGGPDTCIHW